MLGGGEKTLGNICERESSVLSGLYLFNFSSLEYITVFVFKPIKFVLLGCLEGEWNQTGLGIQYVLSCVVLMCLLVVFHLPCTDSRSNCSSSANADIVLHGASCTSINVEDFN